MKTFAYTLCIAGTALALSACETGRTYDSGANYATERTAGDMDGVAPRPAPVRTERVFRSTD